MERIRLHCLHRRAIEMVTIPFSSQVSGDHRPTEMLYAETA